MRVLSFNKFDGGMTNDPRDNRVDVCRVIKGFDNYTRAFKLTPHRSMRLDTLSAGQSEATFDTSQINKMVIGNGTLYGVGVVNGVSDFHTQIYTKLTAADPTSAWTTAAFGSSPGSVEANVGAVLYRNYIYGVNTNGLWRYGDITGSQSFNANEYTLHVPTGQGLVHSKYDIMYWPSNNLILQNDLHTGAGWSVGLTLPVNSQIRSICEDGNYLDIACDQPDGTSVVYKWDTQTSLNDVSEKIDWGNGSIKMIETIGGVLCGISTTSGNLSSLEPHVMFKYYSGTRVITFEEFVCSFVDIRPDHQKYNNLFYFLAEMTINGTKLKGLWKIYKNSLGNMAVSFDISPRNDTELQSGTLKSFLRWGDYLFISYLNPVSRGHTLWRTDEQANYLSTSVFESVINPVEPERYRQGSGIRANKKQLLGMALATEPLTAGQIARLFVRADGGDWKKVIESSVVGTVVKENTFTSEGKRMKNGREHEYKVESYGGAEITDVKWRIEVNDTQL